MTNSTSYKLIILTLLASSYAQAEHLIGQKNKTFSKEKIVIKAGESIKFMNDDGVAHNVFSATTGKKFNLKIQDPGTEKSIKFEKKGEVNVRCAIHPKMKLKVIVE